MIKSYCSFWNLVMLVFQLLSLHVKWIEKWYDRKFSPKTTLIKNLIEQIFLASAQVITEQCIIDRSAIQHKKIWTKLSVLIKSKCSSFSNISTANLPFFDLFFVKLTLTCKNLFLSCFSYIFSSAFFYIIYSYLTLKWHYNVHLECNGYGSSWAKLAH